jgi:hypothetical protein
MNRYWFTTMPPGLGIGLGVGITAYSEADAREIFSAVFGAEVEVDQVKLIEDMHDLEQNHVAPNLGNHFQRGVWYPKGAEQWWPELQSVRSSAGAGGGRRGDPWAAGGRWSPAAALSALIRRAAAVLGDRPR